MRPNTIKDFWKRVEKKSNSECWLWHGVRDKDGCGAFWWNGRTVKCHRFVVSVIQNLDITSKLVCHTCDNPSCVNPHHLFIGTHKDNAVDRETKGRGMRGRNQTPEHVTKKANARRGKMWTPAMKKRMSALKLKQGYRHTPEARAKMSSDRKGISRSGGEKRLGEKNGRVVATEQLVKEIRKLYDAGTRISKLVEMFGLSETQTGRIAKRVHWKHVA